MENGTPEGIRTPGLLLRRQLLYPTELLAHMERVTRIELASPAWKAGALAIVLYPQIPSERIVSLSIISHKPFLVNNLFLFSKIFLSMGTGQ